MKKRRLRIIFFKGIIIISFFLGNLISRTYAQQGEILVNVQVKIMEFGIINTDKRVDPIFKFYLGNENGLLLNKNGSCYKFFSKDPDNTFILPDPKYPALNKELENFTVPILSRPSFTLTMECYLNEMGENCTLDKRDRLHSLTSKIINLNDFAPGDLSDTIRITDSQNHFYSIVQFKYTLVRPSPLKTIAPLELINAANKPIELISTFPLSNKEKLSFTWEYSIDKGNYWNRLTNANKDDLTIKINPLDNLFNSKITTTEKTMFRLRVNSRDTFAISDTLITSFTAPSPSYTSENKQIFKTCTGYDKGGIVINNIQSVSGKVLYILRNATNREACDFQNPSAASCPGFVRSGETLTGSIELKNLATGEYTLLLYNPDLQIGTVATTVNFSISSFSALTVQKAEVKNPTCTNNIAGEINVFIAGGNIRDPLQIALTPAKGNLERKDNQITFKNLSEGDYTVEVTDGCGDNISKIFALRKPPTLIIENITTRTSPELALIFSLKNGSGVYKIIASDAKQYNKTLDSFTNMILQIHPGIWQIKIIDKSDPECLTVDTTVTIGGAKIPVPIKKKRGVTSIPPVNDYNYLQSTYIRSYLRKREEKNHWM